MKAKEFIPASKPRNFVAKNQQTAGAGAHRDKKKEQKQGYEKHKGKGVSEGIRVIDQDYDLDQIILTLDVEGRRASFTYTDYDENFENAERRDVFDQLQEKSWYKGLDHPTKMEILDAAYKAIRGEEPSEYKPRVDDEPLDIDEGSDWGEPKELLSDVMSALERQVEWPLTDVMDRREVQKLLQPVRDAVNAKMKNIGQGVAEDIDIGQEWMSDTELDQYVPDDLQQEWRELVGYDEDGNAHPLWTNMTGDYEPDASDPQHRSWMVRVANKWFAMKKIPNVRFFDVRDRDDELEWLVQIGDQSVQEGDEDPSEEEMDRTVSDLHKDVFGIRPSPEWGREWMSMSEQEKRDLYYQMVDMLDQQQDMSEGYGNKEFEVDGYTYMTDLDREEDNQKIWHMIKTPDGKTVDVDFTPYEYMTKDDVELYVKLDMPKRQGGGPLDSKQLQKMAQIKGVAMLDPKMARAGMSESIPFNQCPHCRGPIFHESLMNEKKDACYHKVRSRYKVWPSAYASGALVQCRKKGAKNWGDKSKK